MQNRLTSSVYVMRDRLHFHYRRAVIVRMTVCSSICVCDESGRYMHIIRLGCIYRTWSAVQCVGFIFSAYSGTLFSTCLHCSNLVLVFSCFKYVCCYCAGGLALVECFCAKVIVYPMSWNGLKIKYFCHSLLSKLPAKWGLLGEAAPLLLFSVFDFLWTTEPFFSSDKTPPAASALTNKVISRHAEVALTLAAEKLSEGGS